MSNTMDQITDDRRIREEFINDMDGMFDEILRLRNVEAEKDEHIEDISDALRENCIGKLENCYDCRYMNVCGK